MATIAPTKVASHALIAMKPLKRPDEAASCWPSRDSHAQCSDSFDSRKAGARVSKSVLGDAWAFSLLVMPSLIALVADACRPSFTAQRVASSAAVRFGELPTLVASLAKGRGPKPNVRSARHRAIGST